MERASLNHSEVFRFKDLVDYAADGIVSKQIIKGNSGNVSLFAFDKGQSLSEHSAPFDALVQVLEGKGLIIIAGKEHSLGAGESVIMPANVPHAVKASDSFKMLLTMIRG